MPAGTLTVFRRALPKLANGTFDLDGHTFNVALTTSAQAITDDFAGASADCRYGDLTNEVAAGGGYTTGGQALASVTWVRSGATVKFDADDSLWTPSTITAKYAVLYDDTPVNKDLLAYVDLDTGGGSVSSAASDFRLSWNAAGLFAMTKSP